jgi:hypothetical protein
MGKFKAKYNNRIELRLTDEELQDAQRCAKELGFDRPSGVFWRYMLRLRASGRMVIVDDAVRHICGSMAEVAGRTMARMIEQFEYEYLEGQRDLKPPR